MCMGRSQVTRHRQGRMPVGFPLVSQASARHLAAGETQVSEHQAGGSRAAAAAVAAAPGRGAAPPREGPATPRAVRATPTAARWRHCCGYLCPSRHVRVGHAALTRRRPHPVAGRPRYRQPPRTTLAQRCSDVPDPAATLQDASGLTSHPLHKRQQRRYASLQPWRSVPAEVSQVGELVNQEQFARGST